MNTVPQQPMHPIKNRKPNINQYLAGMEPLYDETRPSLAALADQCESGLVSIIIPCYNNEQFIGEAIESALNQTYDTKEIIVIDDGSTDNSLDIIKSYSDRIIWRTKENAGAPAARNDGIEIAKGEFIQFLDADDLLYPNKLSSQVEHSQNLPTDSISFCDWKVLNLADNQLIQYLTHTNWNDQNDILPRLATGYIQTSAPLHPRKLLIATGGFDETLPAYQEYDLHLRMACLGFDFVNLPKILYQVHKRSDSVGSNKLRQWRQQNRVIQRACKILQDKGALTYERKTAMAEALIAGARRLMTKGAMSCAWRNFKDACQIHPKGSIPCLRRLVYLLLLNSCSPTVRKCGSRLKQALRS